MPEELLAKVVELADLAGLGPLYVVGLLLAAAVLLVVGRRFLSLKRDPPAPPEPPAAWNTDPAAGATVVPNDTPGGCEDPSRCSG